MKTIGKYSIYNFCILLVLLAIGSCSKEEVLDMFKRQTDAMSFDYLENTQDLAIASSGQWQVSPNANWIAVSPEKGQGASEEQQIGVSVLHNKGDQREGTITLSNGGKSYDITIIQSAGHLSVDRPTVASSFLLDQDLTGAQILIPYTQGAEDDYMNITATLQGPGSEGLSVDEVSNYALSAGDGSVPVTLSGIPTATGEIQFDITVTVPGRNLTQTFVVKSRVKADGGLDPLESPTVTTVKLLPRLAVFDWGTYARNSGVSRKFELELATSQYGPAIRRYANQVDWLSSTSIGTGAYFFDHNRFVFGDLEPGTTYWFRVVHKTINNMNLDSDVTYVQFTTPQEETMGENVLLYKDFDDFWLGGSPIYQAFGVQPTETQIRAGLDPKSTEAKSTDFRTMSWNNNIASTFDGNLGPANAPALYNAYWEGAKYGSDYNNANYAGWHGSNAFAATGVIRLASASAPGFLKTPKLEKINGTADILVTVNTAAYFEPYHSWGEDHLRHAIVIEGDGVIADGGPTMSVMDNNKQVTVACQSNVNPSNNGPLYDYTKPTTHTVKITGATANTRIVVRTLPYSGTDRYRIWLDDIKVEKL